MAEQFAKWLKSAREASYDPITQKPLTQERVADLLNISPEKFSTWETGKREPRTKEDIRRLAEVLGRPEHEVLEALGFDLGERVGLTEPEREALMFLRRFRERPDLQEQAIRVLRALPEPLPSPESMTPTPIRRRSRS